jgi:hypothetical protein
VRGRKSRHREGQLQKDEENCIIALFVAFNKYYSVFDFSMMRFRWQFTFREETILKT